MKQLSLILFFLSFVPFNSLAKENSVEEIRAKFYSASYEKISVADYKNHLDKFEAKESPIYIGYESMYFMLLSRESWNPYTKYNNFLKGKIKLEEAIEKSPKNIELIYLRFCIQRTLPGILNYSNNIEPDKKVILESWDSLNDKDLKERIKKYFIENEIAEESFFKNSIKA